MVCEQDGLYKGKGGWKSVRGARRRKETREKCEISIRKVVNKLKRNKKEA